MLTWVFKALLDWAVGKFTAFIGGLVRVFLREKKIDNRTKEEADKLKAADPNKPQDVKDAVRDSLNGW